MMIIWLYLLLLLFSSIVSATEDAIPIFVLAGDAACEGYASTAQLKELYTSTQPVEVRDEKYGHLMEDDSQNFSTSKTVYVAFDHHHNNDWQVGPLTVGKFAYDPSSFGPELEMGHVLSNVFGDNTPIVIVKAALAKMTLSRDFRPPSSGDWNATRAKESQHWKGAWQYRNLIATIQKTIRNIKEVFGKDNKQALQQFERHGHYIAGIVWFHGYSDLRDGAAEDRNATTTAQSVIDEYETNLANLISDLRKDLRPEDPDEITVVVAELGGRGIDENVPSFEIDFRAMQQRVVEKDEYDYSTMFCPTARFAHVPDPSSSSSSALPLPQSDDYYYRNADTMFEIGAALAGCLLENMYQNGIIQEKNLWNDLISLQDEGATKLLLILFCCGVGVIVLVVVWRRVGRRRQMTTTNMPAHEELELQEVDGTFVNQGDGDEPPAVSANGSNDDDMTNEKKGVLS